MAVGMKMGEGVKKAAEVVSSLTLMWDFLPDSVHVHRGALKNKDSTLSCVSLFVWASR